MLELFVSVFGRIIDWIMALYIHPTIKISCFDIEKTDDGKKSINFSAFISNNTNKTISVSQKYLVIFKGRTEIAKIDVTRYEIVKRRDSFDELSILSPLDDIITLQPGETKEIKTLGYKIKNDRIDKAMFSCYTGRKTYKTRIKKLKKEIAENETAVNETTEQEKNLIKDMLVEWIGKLNKNIGAVTWISTVVVAVIATLLKFMWYVFQRGKLLFWNIDATAISIIDDVTLYSIFLMFILGLVIAGIMLLPLNIIMSKRKIWRIWVEIGLLFITFSAIMLITTGMYSVVEEYGSVGMLAVVIVLVIFFMCFFAPSWAIAISLVQSQGNDKTSSAKGLLFCGILWLVTMTGYIAYLGYDSASSQKDFRTIDEGYAIIYETREYYYLAEYDEQNRIVDKGHQKIIKKENVEYFYDVK